MTFPIEVEFLLNCTHPQPDSAVVNRIQCRLSEGIHWGEVLRLAIPNGALALLSHTLFTYAPGLVPVSTSVQLQAFRQRLEERNRDHAQELIRILQSLKSAGIRTLPFKGPTLALAAYRNIGLREFHDLDFWIAPQQLAQAGEVIRSLGYRAISHRKGMAHEDADRGKRQNDFRREDGKVILELHDVLQSVQFSFTPNFEELWDRRTQLSLDGEEIDALAVDDLLLLTAVHGSKHMWRRLGWAADVAGLITSSPEWNMRYLQARARRLGCERRLHEALSLVDHLWGVKMDLHYRKSLRRSRIHKTTLGWIDKKLFGQVDQRTVTNYTQQALHRIFVSDSLAAAGKIVQSTWKHLVRVDREQMLLPMSGTTEFFYRILCWARQVRHLGSASEVK